MKPEQLQLCLSNTIIQTEAEMKSFILAPLKHKPCDQGQEVGVEGNPVAAAKNAVVRHRRSFSIAEICVIAHTDDS